MKRATRRSADGRWPVDNGTACFDVAVHQIDAAATTPRSAPHPSRTVSPRVLEGEDLTVLTGWAEAVAEALAHGPDRTDALLADAHPDAPWRATMGLAAPSARLGNAFDALRRFVAASGATTCDAMLVGAGRDVPDEEPLDWIVRRALLSMLEERHTRRPQQRA
jgi:hypothetical protein